MEGRKEGREGGREENNLVAKMRKVTNCKVINFAKSVLSRSN
jgi:hypothetical protein